MTLLKRNYELDEKALIQAIQETGGKIDVIYLMQKYAKVPSDIARNELNKISKQDFKRLTEHIDKCLTITVENNLTHLLCVGPDYFIRSKSFEGYREYQESEEYQQYIKYVMPVAHRINDLHLYIVSKQLSSSKNINHYDVLIKSLNTAFKYLNSIKSKFNLNIETMNYFTQGLLQKICYVVDAVFNPERFIEFNINIEKLTDVLVTLHDAFFKEKEFDKQEGIRKEIKIIECELDTINGIQYDKIIGYNEIDGLYNIKPNELEFNFEELKNMIKLKFNTNNKEVENIEQLKYVSWIMQLKANKKNGVLPFQDKFILDNMIVPWSHELRELLGEDFDNTNFNIDEAINYIGRLRDKGEYKSQYYKIKALKKVFDYRITEGYNNNAQLVRLDMSRDYINSEASDIGLLMLNVLSEDGQVIKPYNFKGKEMYFVKEGPAVSDEALNLFHYLIGEIEDNVPNTSEITGMKFYKTEFCKSMKKDLRGKKFYYIADLVRELQQVQYKIFTSEEYEKIKTSQRRAKAIPLFTYDEIDFNGDDIELNFNIPIVKYFRGLNRFARAINRDITSIMFSRPRIYKIARYAVMESFRNENDVLRKIDTLIESIGDSERFNNDSNKRRYLAKLKDDVERANSYLISGASIKMDKCNVGTKAEARVLISGTSKLALKNKNAKKR